MSTPTQLQRLLIIIYAGSAYSSYRDNELKKLKSKAIAYLNKNQNDQIQYGGGVALMIIENVLSKNPKFVGSNNDEILQKIWLSIAIGFESVNIYKHIGDLLKIPRILLKIMRLFSAPSTRDKKFEIWVNKYNNELSAFVTLISGLDNINDKNLYRIIFENINR